MTQTITLVTPDTNGNLPVDIKNITQPLSVNVGNFPAPMTHVAPNNWNANQVTLNPNTVVQVVPARVGVAGTGRVSLTVINETGTDYCYFGPANTVTSNTGIFIPPVLGASIEIDTTAAVYGITLSSSQVVAFFETY